MTLWIHDRQKAKDLTEKHSLKGYHLERKYDGHRLTIFVQEDRSFRAFGRKTEAKNELTKKISRFEWYRDLLSLNLPPLTTLDGEIWIPSTPATSVSSALAGSCFDLRFTIFAVPFYNGKDISQEPASELLNLVPWLSPWLPEKVSIAGSVTLNGLNNLFPTWKSVSSWEGLVIKKKIYSEWYKYKPSKTIDAVITGFTDGKGKYKDLPGAICLSLYNSRKALVPLCRVSGMTDEIRQNLCSADLGKVVEIEFQNMASRGGLRHPRFLRFRPDKPSSECTLDQLKGM